MAQYNSSIPVSDNVIDLIPIMWSNGCYLKFIVFNLCAHQSGWNVSFSIFTRWQTEMPFLRFCLLIEQRTPSEYWISFLNIDFIARQHTHSNYLSVSQRATQNRRIVAAHYIGHINFIIFSFIIIGMKIKKNTEKAMPRKVSGHQQNDIYIADNSTAHSASRWICSFPVKQVTINRYFNCKQIRKLIYERANIWKRTAFNAISFTVELVELNKWADLPCLCLAFALTARVQISNRINWLRNNGNNVLKRANRNQTQSKWNW